MEIRDRIREVRLQANNGEKMMQTEFAERIGLKMSTVSQIERGKLNPTAQTIELISRTFDINKKWLETGEGPMKKEIPPRDEVAEIIYDVLQIGEDDPVYGFILHFLKTYQQMNEVKRETVRQLIKGLLEQQGDTPSTYQEE